MIDGYGFDRKFHDNFMKFLDVVARFWWRVDVEGIENIPDDGPGLIVMNHAGTIALDVLMVKHAIYRRNRRRRIAWTLMADFLPSTPFVGDVYWKTGNVLACWENGHRLLQEDQLVIVCPEGTHGVGKHFSQRYQLMPFGKGGFARLADDRDVPIIPLAVVGSEEIYPVIYRNYTLGKWFGFPFLPFTFTFPWLGPLGFVPLPSKWMMRFSPPLRPSDYRTANLKESEASLALAHDVTGSITSSLHELLARRPSAFFA